MDSEPVILDMGSATCKVGTAGDDTPTAVLPSIAANNDSEYFIHRGIVTNYDNMSKAWNTMFYNSLRKAPEDQPLLVTEPILNPKINREKMMELAFEQFNVPAYFAALQGLLTVYSSGRNSAMAVDIGHGTVQITPVFEGIVVSQALVKQSFAGFDVTEFLKQLILSSNTNPPKRSLHSIATLNEYEQVKHKLCHVALHYEEELSLLNQPDNVHDTFTLPDGTAVTLGSEQITCTESLFKPTMVQQTPSNQQQQHIHSSNITSLLPLDLLIKNSIDQCDDPNISDRMRNNIYLSGGSSLLKGINERLKHELESKYKTKVRIIEAPGRELSSFIGASILGSLTTFASIVVERAEYDEHGAGIVHKKCAM